MNSRRTSRALSEADAEALLSGRAVAEHEDLHEVVGLMKAVSAMPAPTPTAALAAVLHNGFDPLPVESPQSPSWLARWSVRIAVATAAAMTATLGAATANALPPPVQNAVADVVGALTPLQLPRRPELGGTGSDEGDREPAGPADVRHPETGAGLSPESADETPATPDTAPRAGTSDDSDDSDTDERDDATDTEEPDVDDAEPDTDEPETDERDDSTDTAVPGADQPETDTADAAPSKWSATTTDAPASSSATGRPIQRSGRR